MLHALQDRGEVRLLAVTIGTRDPWCTVYVDLLGHLQRARAGETMTQLASQPPLTLPLTPPPAGR